MAQIVVKEFPAQLLPAVHEAHHQVVAVAAEGVDGVGGAQVHQEAQGLQAPFPLLQHIAQDKEDIVPAEARLGQHGLEVVRGAVDIAHRQDAPVGGQVHSYDFGFQHGRDLALFS